MVKFSLATTLSALLLSTALCASAHAERYYAEKYDNVAAIAYGNSSIGMGVSGHSEALKKLPENFKAILDYINQPNADPAVIKDKMALLDKGLIEAQSRFDTVRAFIKDFKNSDDPASLFAGVPFAVINNKVIRGEIPLTHDLRDRHAALFLTDIANEEKPLNAWKGKRGSLDIYIEAVSEYKKVETALAALEKYKQDAERSRYPGAIDLSSAVDEMKAKMDALGGVIDKAYSILLDKESSQDISSLFKPQSLAQLVNDAMAPYTKVVASLMDVRSESIYLSSFSDSLDELAKLAQNYVPVEDSTDTRDRFTSDFRASDRGTKALRLTIGGRDMTLFINFDTGNVVGYGYTGIGGAAVAPLGASGMDYSQGVFVGKISADGTQIIGEFSGITGATAFDDDFHTVSVPGGDATSVRIINLPYGAFHENGSGGIEVNISIGVGNGGVARNLYYQTSTSLADPYKLGSGYNLTGTSTGAPVTYVGYGRVLSQDRQAQTTRPTTVMDDLGDLQVTVNSARSSENVTFSFNGSDPQATATRAVVNDRIAGGVSQLAQNVLRTGVMFPLENYNHTNLVHFTDFSNGLNNASSSDIAYGFGVVGKPTPVSDLPTGSATYTGGAAGYATETAILPGEITRLDQFYGNTTLNVDFDSSSVTGTINTFRHVDGVALSSFNLSGSVVSNGLSFSMTDSGTGTGSGKGTFFGPAANEVGGQFTTTSGDVTQEGVFWGVR